MFALGAQTKKEDSEWKEFFKIGARVTETCYMLYKSQPTGIGAEITSVAGWVPTSSYYILRPEVIESIFYMWRFTHDQKYRDWGMEIAKV